MEWSAVNQGRNQGWSLQPPYKSRLCYDNFLFSSIISSSCCHYLINLISLVIDRVNCSPLSSVFKQKAHTQWLYARCLALLTKFTRENRSQNWLIYWALCDISYKIIDLGRLSPTRKQRKRFALSNCSINHRTISVYGRCTRNGPHTNDSNGT